MKTAMQELISQMHELTWKLMTYEQKIEVFYIFLEKEKEQIIKAYEDGADHGMDVVEDGLDYVHSTEYFNQTYTK